VLGRLPTIDACDPPRILRAADVLGRLAGRGLVSGAEALAPLVASARAEAPRRDASGMQARLAHALGDAAAAEALRRERAAAMVRAALVAARLAGLNGAQARAAAEAANRGVLSAAEIGAIALGRKVGGFAPEPPLGAAPPDPHPLVGPRPCPPSESPVDAGLGALPPAGSRGGAPGLLSPSERPDGR
jgi:hypothetical protein